MSVPADSEIKDFSAVITSVFSNISPIEARRAQTTMDVWQKVLLGIKTSANPNEGRNLAEHSRIIELKKGVLFIETDHPGWTELLRMHKKFILRGIEMYAPGLGVQTLAFRLKGQRGNITGQEYSAQEA